MQQRQRVVYERDQIRFQTLGGRDDYRYHRMEASMKPSSEDKTEGTLHEVKGKIKEVAEKITEVKKVLGT